jgi:hypothetical protein
MRQHKNYNDEQHGLPPNNGGELRCLREVNQFPLLIIHPPCYSYIQSSPIKVLKIQKRLSEAVNRRSTDNAMSNYQKDKQ